MSRNWSRALGISPPSLDAVANHREAHTYALLIVALLERDEPMTLAEVAARFEAAGIADRARALLSLQRCKPARPPIYRDGDHYHLDPRDDELDLWAFRLGLVPPRVAPPPPPSAPPAPLPGPETALTPAELDEAWKDASLRATSARRVALAVLDAHGGPLAPAEVVAAVTARTRAHTLRVQAEGFLQRGSPVEVLADGRWAIAADAGEALAQARTAVRDRIVTARKYAGIRLSPEMIDRSIAESERRQAQHAAELAKLSRALLVGFPADRPAAVALLDVGRREIVTLVGEELADLPARLAGFDVLGALDVRGLLRALGFDPGERRLAELGPPQKTKKLGARGRTLHITTAMLVQGSCGISQPFGDSEKLAAYLAGGDLTRLRRRLEADVKSLHALYEYGRLHHAVRLRWGFLDEWIPVPWAHPDEPSLYGLMRSALAMEVPLEVVVGSAPGWSDPWARVRLAHVQEEGWQMRLYDADGRPIPEGDVQRARLPVVH